MMIAVEESMEDTMLVKDICKKGCVNIDSDASSVAKQDTLREIAQVQCQNVLIAVAVVI
jgi:hypothetical protein